MVGIRAGEFLLSLCLYPCDIFCLSSSQLKAEKKLGYQSWSIDMLQIFLAIRVGAKLIDSLKADVRLCKNIHHVEFYYFLRDALLF